MTYKPQEEDQDFLTRVVVDTSLRKFYLYSSEGNSRDVECETVEQFMNVLELVRALIKEDEIVYAEPLVTSAE
jgi:galactokinase